MLGVFFKREAKDWMQDQWEQVFHNFAIDMIWECEHTAQDYVAERTTVAIGSAEDLPRDIPLIVLSHNGAKYYKGNESLITFQHPQDAIYMFGGSHSIMSGKDFGEREPDSIVFIPTLRHEMYAFSAAYITLYDRLLKREIAG